IQRGGFPPVHLSEINFQSMYEQQRAQAAATADGAPRIIT
ncbi:MAG: protein-export chaperone SecB, partial [Burkholderiaceae bacterium]